MEKIDDYIDTYRRMYRMFLKDKRMYKKAGKLEEMRKSQELETRYHQFLFVLEDIKKG